MKRKTALYNIKQAYLTWNPAENYTEFFQVVNNILKDFEKSIKDDTRKEGLVFTCKECDGDMTIRRMDIDIICNNSFCNEYSKLKKITNEK